MDDRRKVAPTPHLVRSEPAYSRTMTARIRLSRKQFFYRAQDRTCHLQRTIECRAVGGEMHPNLTKWGPRRATWDHIKPQSEGGRDPYNVLLACEQCNGSRGDIYPAPYGAAQRAHALWEKWLAQEPEPTPPKPAKRKRQKKLSEPGSIQLGRMIASTLEIEDDQGRREVRAALLKRST